MAKVKLRELGTVVKIHESGLVETNKGIRACIKAQQGDRLVMNSSRKVSIVVPKKTQPKKTSKDKTSIETSTKLEIEKELDLEVVNDVDNEVINEEV